MQRQRGGGLRTAEGDFAKPPKRHTLSRFGICVTLAQRFHMSARTTFHTVTWLPGMTRSFVYEYRGSNSQLTNVDIYIQSEGRSRRCLYCSSAKATPVLHAVSGSVTHAGIIPRFIIFSKS